MPRVKSSNIYRVEWADHNLDVTFKQKPDQDVPGETYRYFGVPESIYTLMIHAKSVGQYFNTWVKQTGYKYTKLENHQPPPQTVEQLEDDMEREKQELISFMEKKDLVRREMDEQGNERIIVTGDIAQEMIHSFLSLPERFQKNKVVIKNLVEVILKQNLNNNLKKFKQTLFEFAKEKQK